MGKKSIIDVGKLSEPATELINRVSDAVGGIAKPWQIKRVANAKAEAAKIAARAQVEVTEIEERGLRRMIEEQARDQENIENITQKAIPHLNEDANPTELDEDYLRYFFSHAKLVSDSDVQEFWAKILAGEVNARGTFSRRAIDLVSKLDRREAELIERLCSNAWGEDGNFLIIKAPSIAEDNMQKFSVLFSELSELDAIGVISFNKLSGFKFTGHPKRIKLQYHGLTLYLEFESDKDNSLPVGDAVFTAVGREVAKIIAPPGYKGVVNEACKHFIELGISVAIDRDSMNAFAELLD